RLLPPSPTRRSSDLSEVRQSAVLPKPASDRGTMTPVARADDLARVVDVSRALACDRGPHAGLPSPSPVATIAIPARADDLASIVDRLRQEREPASARDSEVGHHPVVPEERVGSVVARTVAHDLALVVDALRDAGRI